MFFSHFQCFLSKHSQSGWYKTNSAAVWLNLWRDGKTPHFQKKSFFILSLLRLLSWLISYKVFFYQSKQKNLFFFDRYAHDILIDPLRYKHGLSQNLTKFILHFFPKPDLWIFLNPPIKTIKLRKLELPDNELKRQIKFYKKFFTKQKNVLILDTNIQKTKLIKKIVELINHLIKWKIF